MRIIFRLCAFLSFFSLAFMIFLLFLFHNYIIDYSIIHFIVYLYESTRSRKMLAKSMVFGNIDGNINRPVDQSCLDGKRLSCSPVDMPSTIFQEDAVEPKTGVKFPAFLEDDSCPATTKLSSGPTPGCSPVTMLLRPSATYTQRFHAAAPLAHGPGAQPPTAPPRTCLGSSNLMTMTMTSSRLRF